MTEFKLSSEIFRTANGETILLTGSELKTVGQLAPSGYGLSASHVGSGPAKYNAIARSLDMLLINKVARCLEGSVAIYCELTIGTTTHRVLCDGNTDTYDGPAPDGAEKFIPLMLYHLRGESTNTELKECFNRIVYDFITTRQAKVKDIIQFCDCFYYTIAAGRGDTYKVRDNELQLATVRAAIRSDALSPFFSPLNELVPDIYAEEHHTVPEKKNKKASEDNLYEEIKAGGKRIAFDWNENQKNRIPSLSTLNNFVPGNEFYSILNKVTVRMNKVIARLDAGIEGVDAIGKDYINLLMVGKAGTGKTTLAYALGASTGMPVYTVPINKDTESDVFQGMTKVVDGKFEFVTTDFLDAYKNGGIVVLEEINLANPNVVMGTIGQSIEFPFILMENGYKAIRRHPLCIIIGTMNVGTHGSTGLNEAFSSRFKSTYILEDPADEDFIKILMKSGAEKKTCEWVHKIYKKIIAYLMSPENNAEDMCMSLTMRGCFGALECIEEGETQKDAIRRTLIGKIAETDLVLANKVWSVVQNLSN